MATLRELEYELMRTPDNEFEGLLEFDSEEEWEQNGLGEDQPEYFWPVVLRVAAIGARGAAPLFRIVGRRLGPAAARAAATRLPGVFVRGTSRQVRTFARSVGGRLVGPERHGQGLRHYHLIRPGGDRIHIWFGRRMPRGDFFEGPVATLAEAELEQILARVDEAVDASTQRPGEFNREEEFEMEAFSVSALRQMWQALPPDLKRQLWVQVRHLWSVRGPLLLSVRRSLPRLMGLAAMLVTRRGLPPSVAIRRAAQVVRRLPPPRGGSQGRFRNTQVRQYHRRQQQRGRQPGRTSIRRRRREAEVIMR